MREDKSLRRLVGFWPSLLNTPLGQLLIPEGVVAFLLGGGGGFALLGILTLEQRVGLVGDFLILLGPLLGIVFAALALVASLMSDAYLAWLKTEADETGQGVLAFFTPFMLSLGFQVGALLGALGYRALAAHLPSTWEQVLFPLVVALAIFALLEVVALGRAVLIHTYTRASEAEIRSLETRVQGLRRKAD